MNRFVMGKLLEIGLQGKNYETKKGILILYFEYLLILSISVILTILSFVGKFIIFGSSLTSFIICFLFSVFIILIILFMGGQEIDGVYEFGLTYRWVGLIKKIQGKYWIPWDKVEKIYYGNIYLGEKLGISEYIRIISEDKDTTPFIRYLYDKQNPKFYELLLKTLKEKSPQAKWINENLNFNNK